ncbi:uncharacterized protein FIBRA_00636 [Fibroporia radiculosa]|uniref:Cytochrome P450 n=1 Tax=Fibroporia radiculosa TaxID=599839 RepID=J4H0D7_9APHY|nr:uncharacterized protein FIBRA_00636 [Fibroporia radiculosa]CCL98634.1 predicted protein [Fibroporia radiculosa]
MSVSGDIHLSDWISVRNIGLVVLFYILSAFARRILRNYTLSGLSGPPAPSWLLGHGVQIQASPVGTLYNKWSEKYGPTYKLKGPFGTSVLAIGDPKGAGHILTSSNYVRPTGDRIGLQLFVSPRLLFQNISNVQQFGQEHKEQRAIISPAFRCSQVHSFDICGAYDTGTVSSAAVREVSNVIFDLAHKLKTDMDDEINQDDSKVFEMFSRVPRLTLDAISMTTFAYDVSHSDRPIPKLISQIIDVPQTTLTFAVSAMTVLIPELLYIPNPMKRWTTMLRTEFQAIADTVWTQQERGIGMHSKLLDALHNSEKITGKPFNRDLAITLITGTIFAGYETAANVIMECLFELARQPQIQDKLRAELVAFTEHVGREPTYDDLMNGQHLTYLDAVIRETIRTKAMQMTLKRQALEADTIPLQFPLPTGETHITVTSGQYIHIPIRDGINTDPRIWGADAAIFRPERWLELGGLPEVVSSIRAPAHLMTFGDGAKICAGRNFALAEIKIVISVLVRHLVFEPDGEEYVFYKTGGNTIKPKIRGREGEGAQLHLRVRRYLVE